MMLAGRIGLVTGGGRGIGAAVAAELARQGAAVFVVARTETEVRDVARQIEEQSGAAAYAVADVTDRDSVVRAAAACTERFGAPDTVVTAAGAYGPIGRSWEVDPAAWWRAQEVNVLGTLHVLQATLPGMLEQGRGRIIAFSGGGATAPLPRFSAYAASKAAVVRLVETIAEEARGTGVTANAIAPGAVDTRLQDEVLAAGAAAGELYERMKRLRETGEGGVPPELAARLAAFLASDDAAGITGKLVSAPHDGWQAWDQARIRELGESAWFTLRRLDEFTIRPLLPALHRADA